MEENNNMVQGVEKQSSWSRISKSKAVGFVMICILSLFMFIPLNMVQDLIRDRQYINENVKKEITSKWGSGVEVMAPVLEVPYWDIEKNDRGVEEQVNKTAYFFPEELNVNSDVKSQLKHRNNYKVVVFGLELDFSGYFSKPKFNNEDRVMWEKARFVVKTTDIESIKDYVSINIDGKDYTFEPTTSGNEVADDYDTYGIGKIDRKVSTLKTSEVNIKDFAGKFRMKMKYNGSETVKIVPIGKTTKAEMKSDWDKPSFAGNFLPDNKEINKDGFKADWKILNINRALAQSYYDTELPMIMRNTFDVNFSTSVDGYSQSDRATKYGFLVICLTFILFYLLNALSNSSIHIFQYTMIGIALAVFYTLLISITEHSNFTIAYVISAVMTVLLISLYSKTIIERKNTPYIIGGVLSVLYVFIYFIIQLEDYALLVGSIGLFMIIAGIMYFSRKIQW